MKELLERLPARIHCLIRAAGREEAGARLERKLRAYGLWEEHFRERIEPVPGDLAEPGLGLSSAQLEALAGRVDAIYHCGAVVSFLYPYREMRAPNVQATQALLELACQGRPKVFHHVSTLSVFPPHLRQGGGLLAEDDGIEGATGFRTGYAQSKWVAERLVAQARSRGMQVNIYRLGNVTGHSQTGVWNTTDFVTRSLKSFIQLGSMPVLDGTLDLLPVDFVAKAIVHLAQEPQSLGRTFHMSHPRPVSAGLLRGWLETLGYSLRSLSQTEWLDELRRETERRDHNALFALAPLIGARGRRAARVPCNCFHPGGAWITGTRARDWRAVASNARGWTSPFSAPTSSTSSRAASSARLEPNPRPTPAGALPPSRTPLEAACPGSAGCPAGPPRAADGRASGRDRG